MEKTKEQEKDCFLKKLHVGNFFVNTDGTENYTTNQNTE